MSATYQDSGVLSLEAAVEQYFAQLNPIAQRIARDIRETKSKYGQLWCTLNLHEQSEVINETLIKPEISLRYFDNFVSSSSSLSSSSSSTSSAHLSSPSCSDLVLCHITHEMERTSVSTDSLLNKTITELALPRAARPAQQSCIKSSATKNKSKSLDFKNYYAFDGRNLKTFAHQKVAQKIIQDDTTSGGTGGGYRDEHSIPFSYRTKSQINLYTLDGADHNTKKTATYFAPSDDVDIEDDMDQICLLSCSLKSTDICDDAKPSISILNTANHKKLQHELKINLGTHQFEKKPDAAAADNSRTAAHYNRLDNANNFFPPLAVNQQKMCVDKKLNISNNNSSKNEILLKTSFIDAAPGMKAATSTSTAITYATYTDGYFEHEESSNLMQSCGNSDVLTASSSSAATSDDDRDDDYNDDEKTLCEDVKLLDNDINLRRGFDFLNNW